MRALASLTGAAIGLTLSLASALAAEPPTVAATATAAAAPTTVLSPANEGRRLWLKLNCYGCHGNNAAGGMGPNVQHAETGDLSEAVHGDALEGGMPSFSRYLGATDINNLAAYLNSIGTKNEPKWFDWWVANPKH